MKFKDIEEARSNQAEYDSLLRQFAREATDMGAGLEHKAPANYEHPVIAKRIAYMKKNLKVLKKMGNEVFDLFYKQRDF